MELQLPTTGLLTRIAATGSPNFDPNPEFVAFGVATEYCVRRAAEGLLRRGRRVVAVTNAVRSLNPGKGREILANLQSCGARLIAYRGSFGSRPCLALETVAKMVGKNGAALRPLPYAGNTCPAPDQESRRI